MEIAERLTRGFQSPIPFLPHPKDRSLCYIDLKDSERARNFGHLLSRVAEFGSVKFTAFIAGEIRTDPLPLYIDKTIVLLNPSGLSDDYIDQLKANPSYPPSTGSAFEAIQAILEAVPPDQPVRHELPALKNGC